MEISRAIIESTHWMLIMPEIQAELNRRGIIDIFRANSARKLPAAKEHLTMLEEAALLPQDQQPALQGGLDKRIDLYRKAIDQYTTVVNMREIQVLPSRKFTHFGDGISSCHYELFCFEPTTTMPVQTDELVHTWVAIGTRHSGQEEFEYMHKAAFEDETALWLAELADIICIDSTLDLDI